MRPTLRTLLALLIVGSLHAPAATPQVTGTLTYNFKRK
jgi:hypothetical protein